MSTAVLYIATSLDGFIAGPDDDISWLLRYNEVDYGYAEFFSSVGVIIQGRRAYDIEVQNGWENAHPVPTFVLSHQVRDPALLRPGVVFTSEDIEAVLSRARQLTARKIWIEGGANVAQQFIRMDLIDEIVLSIVPVILGDGIRLFGKTDAAVELTLRETRTFDKGLVQLTYTRERT